MEENLEQLQEDEILQKEPGEEVPVKSMWQLQKESWYDKIPLNLKQLDTIIWVSLILLVITFIVIGLDAADIFNPFGY